jgi:hypothetical protein
MILKGYRTAIFGVAVILAGLGEMTDVINVVSPELGRSSTSAFWHWYFDFEIFDNNTNWC